MKKESQKKGELLGKLGITTDENRAMVTKNSPTLQLQFLFTNIDHKQQKIRELKAEIKAEFEAAPGWMKIVQDQEDINEKKKILKEAIQEKIPEAFKDIAELEQELAIEMGKFRTKALPVLIGGKQVTMDGGNGMKFIAELDVVIKPLGIKPDEQKDEQEKLSE